MVKKCNLVVFNAEMVSIGAKKNELLRPSTLVGASQSNSIKIQSVDLLVERLRRLGSARSARKLSLSIDNTKPICYNIAKKNSHVVLISVSEVFIWQTAKTETSLLTALWAL